MILSYFLENVSMSLHIVTIEKIASCLSCLGSNFPLVLSSEQDKLFLGVLSCLGCGKVLKSGHCYE